MFDIQCLRTGRFYDLFPDTVLSFSMESPAYLGGMSDGMPIQGQYVYQFDMPLNAHIIGHAHRIQDPRPLARDLPIVILVKKDAISAGLPLFQGVLSMTAKPKQGKANVQIILNGLSTLRDVLMSDTDLGKLPTMSAGDWYAHATDTCLHPSRHDWICYPVWNYGFAGSTTPFFTQKAFQNGWVDGQFGCGFLTPHLKVDAVLRRLFKGLGYTFQNNVLITKELSWLTLVNNCSLNHPTDTSLGILDTTYALSRAMPHTPANEWLRHLVRRLGAILLINAFEKTVVLEKWSSLRQPKTVLDFARKEVNVQDTQVESLEKEHVNALEDAYFPSILPKDTYLSAYFKEGTSPPIPYAPTLKQGIYTENNAAYHWVQTVSRGDFNRQLIHRTLLGGVHGAYRFQAALPSEKTGLYQSPYNQALLTQVPMDIVNAWNDPIPIERHTLPALVQKGNTPETSRLDWAENQNVLLFFRGMTQLSNGTPYPLATSERKGFDNQHIQVGASQPLSLSEYDFRVYAALHQTDWRNGDTDLEEELQANITFVQGLRKQVTKYFKLSLLDLKQFNFMKGVYCDNMLFLVQKVAFTISKRTGLSLVQMTLLPNL